MASSISHALPDRDQVLATHNEFWQAYAERDLQRRFAVCAPDITFFGTGRHERAHGIDQYRAMNLKGLEQFPMAFSIQMLWTEIRVQDSVAWVECDSIWMKTEEDRCTKDEVRLTTILKKTADRWLVAHVHGSAPDFRLHEGEYMLHADARARNQQLEREVAQRTRDLSLAKEAADDLLRNILPATVVEELHAHGRVKPRLHRNVTVLFADFRDFTRHSESLSPEALVDELNECFTAFDNLVSRHRVEKIKTMGDAYLAVAGLPEPRTDHAMEATRLAIAMRDHMRARKARLGPDSLGIRIGLHSGEVVAGIVGVRKFAYDIWGDTVNTAARLQQECMEGQVNISAATHELIKDHFTCWYRGEIEAKHKGRLKMFFVEPRNQTKHEDPASLRPSWVHDVA